MKKLFLIMFCLLTMNIFAEPTPKKDWTIMVFLNGDNNLDYYAFLDFNEMEKVGSTDWMNIIVQYDRYEATSDADWSTTRRYYVTKDDNPLQMNSEMLEELGETDSGNYTNVINFVDWAVTNYPAENYGLILWDHGSGWQKKRGTSKRNLLKAFSSDDTDGGVISIANGEYEQILSAAVNKIGKKIDFVGFDACLMAMWEVHYVSERYAKYFAGSEETEGADGWVYDAFLTPFVNGERSAENLCKQIPLSSLESVGSTLSCVNLQMMEPLNIAIKKFSDYASRNTNLDTKIMQAFSQTFGMMSIPEYKDLYSFFDNLKRTSSSFDVLSLTNPVLSAIRAFVIENRTSSEFSSSKGVTIYMPFDAGYYDSLYDAGRWSVETNWDDFIKRIMFTDDDYPNNHYLITDEDKLNETQNGQIQYVNDIDYFYIDVKASTKYTFETELLSITNTFMYLFDENGEEITSNDNINDETNFASIIQWKALKDERIYVAVKAFLDETGEYVLKYTESYDCVETNNGVEICDGIDNDCDEIIDNGNESMCEITNAKSSVCEEGVCKVKECNDNFHNIDLNSENGCEYSCTLSNNGIEACDNIDNNCDGTVDNGDNMCTLANGSGSCEEGKCELNSCEDNFYNNDSNSENGCEYSCTPTNNGTETCDEIDNNCDGKVDEGVCPNKKSEDSSCNFGNGNNSYLTFFMLFGLLFLIKRKTAK